MLSNLTVKKLLSITLSIAWIDFVASQMCIQHAHCFKILCPFCLYGLLPVIVAWLFFWLFLEISKEKTGPEKKRHDSDLP